MLEEKIEESLLGKISSAVRRNAGVYLLAGGLAVGYAGCGATISPDGTKYKEPFSDEWKDCKCQKNSDCDSGKCYGCFCAQCGDDSQCGGIAPYCVNNSCVECKADYSCNGFKRDICNHGKCVECEWNNDCGEGEKCISGGTCL